MADIEPQRSLHLVHTTPCPKPRPHPPLREPRLLSAPSDCSESPAPPSRCLSPCPASISHALSQNSFSEPLPLELFPASSLVGHAPPYFADHALAPPQTSWPYPYLVTGGDRRRRLLGSGTARRAALGAGLLLRALRGPGNNGAVRAGRAASGRAAGAGAARGRGAGDRCSG